MSINVPDHFVQQYTTNLSLLLQQQGSLLRGAVMSGAHAGEKAAVVDQISSLEMQEVTTRFAPMPRQDVEVDRRWVEPTDYDLTQMLDTFDKLRLITEPESMYTMNSLLAAGRRMDRTIIQAFLAPAKTGKNAGTNTAFTVANTIDKNVGAANSRLNVEKLLTVRELMQENHVDFDREEVYVGVTAKDQTALLKEIQVVSRDYNDGVALKDGKIDSFLGFRFLHCQLIETVNAGVNKVNLPVWVKSGMHLGIWQDVSASLDRRTDTQGIPWQLYTRLTLGATRTEENRVYNIESHRA